MPSEPRPACHQYLNADEFEATTDRHLARLEPCRFCFPEGVVDVDRDDLLVAAAGSKNRQAFHRCEATGPPEFQAAGADEPSLGRALRSDDVTSLDDLPDGVLGGDA